jgi:NADPH-dependent glutamate synthase beta subunit-like oxidoreductase/CO/xanthine dehydrogenase FAD-binding subunit
MKSIKNFKHINANTVNDAISILRRYRNKAWVVSGGTDLVGTMRFEVLHDYPEVVVNLKTIPGLDYIREEDGLLKIGALTRLEDIANSPLINGSYRAVSQAAGRTASPHIRAMGTISGNICQLIRCWYFRKEDNRFDCIRKGGAMCHAAVGDNRYHSIFGATRVAAPPCTSNCPAANDIPSYLSYIRQDKLLEAAKVLLDSNPLPAITGRVCPHTCEQDCNRTELDEALSIRSIERFVGDYILDHAPRLLPPPRKENPHKIAIVGSGPAGLSCACYLRKQGYNITILESREKAGGILNYGIPPYRLPKNIVRKQIKAIRDMGVKFKFKVEAGKDISLADLQRKYDAVFLATGAWKQPALGIKNEDLLVSGLDFLTRVNQGLRKISADRVLVIGGGSVAVDVATSALRLGANEVTMACLESRAEMPALPDEVEQALREGLKLLPSRAPSRVIKRKGKLAGMELVRCASVFDSQGKFAPVYDQTVKEQVSADLVILAIGQRPDLAYAKSSLKIDRGLLAVDPDSQATSLAGVFAGGDAAISGPLSVVAAIASGRRAAEAIHRYLGGRNLSRVKPEVEHLTRCNGDCLDKLARVKTPELSLSLLSLDGEDTAGLDSTSAETEANRCLNCGCVAVNPSDIAAALVALDAKIITSARTIKAEDFWSVDKQVKSTVLEDDEIVTEIQIPTPAAGVKTAFVKFALRKSIDFPIVNCAAALGGSTVRICLNAVYNKPYRATKAEDAIKGKKIDEASAEEAGNAAVSDAVALSYTKYKIQIARAMVKKAILACK